jgi:hypothetical protein
MGNALNEIDSAIDEVQKAHRWVKARTTRQVSAVEEINRLKSVSYAWFQTHRPSVADEPPRPDLSAVDAAYRTVLEATGRHASRKTYEEALRTAKQELVAVRSLVATMPASLPVVTGRSGSTDSPPNFAPLAADPRMQQILGRRWIEVQQCTGSTAYLAATVMMGGLLETLLLARINASAKLAAIFTAKHAPRDKSGKPLALPDWKLVNMVEVAFELDWITKPAKEVGQVLRDFRNYIHPHKEFAEGIVICEDDARMFWEVTKAISRQVLGSVGKTP